MARLRAYAARSARGAPRREPHPRVRLASGYAKHTALTDPLSRPAVSRHLVSTRPFELCEALTSRSTPRPSRNGLGTGAEPACRAREGTRARGMAGMGSLRRRERRRRWQQRWPSSTSTCIPTPLTERDVESTCIDCNIRRAEQHICTGRAGARSTLLHDRAVVDMWWLMEPCASVKVNQGSEHHPGCACDCATAPVLRVRLWADRRERVYLLCL